MVTITGETFLWELQIGLHGFLKRGLSKIFFMRMQRPGNAQAALVFSSQQKAAEISQYLMLTVTFIRLLLPNKEARSSMQ